MKIAEMPVIASTGEVRGSVMKNKREAKEPVIASASEAISFSVNLDQIASLALAMTVI